MYLELLLLSGCRNQCANVAAEDTVPQLYGRPDPSPTWGGNFILAETQLLFLASAVHLSLYFSLAHMHICSLTHTQTYTA